MLDSEDDEEKKNEDQEDQIVGDDADKNISAANLEKFEILSAIDPEDEFLQSEHSYSLIERLSDNKSSFDVLSNQSSEFSVLSGSKMHSILQNLKAEESMSLASQIVSAAGDDEEKQSLVSMLNSSRFSVV